MFSISRAAIIFKFRYDRGKAWLSYLNPVFLMFGIAYYKTVLEQSAYLIPIGFLYVGMCYSIGFFDERYGIWKKEIEYGTHELNNFNQAVMKKLDRILENDR